MRFLKKRKTFFVKAPNPVNSPPARLAPMFYLHYYSIISGRTVACYSWAFRRSDVHALTSRALARPATGRSPRHVRRRAQAIMPEMWWQQAASPGLPRISSRAPVLEIGTSTKVQRPASTFSAIFVFLANSVANF